MTTTQHALRSLAMAHDASASVPFELAAFWQKLRSGAWLFSDTFSTSERFYALLCQPARPEPLDRRKLELLEAMLLGGRPKVVAMERDRALSTISMAVQDCLRSMGLSARPSQASVLLSMAAIALHRPGFAPARGRLSEVAFKERSYLVVSALRPDLQFPVRLSDAEAAVLRSLVAGNSYAQISGERATSPRTVANQLTTASRKLGVSGRRAIIERLIQHSAQFG